MFSAQLQTPSTAGDYLGQLSGRICGGTEPENHHPAAQSLLSFAQMMYAGFQIGRHHEKIAEALESVEAGHIKRLMISMPPRHGKSLLASTLFPAWAMGRDPNLRFIACSYGAKLAHDFSRKVRNTIAMEEYREIFPSVQLAADARERSNWEIAPPFRGGYVAAGVGGGITGKGADILLIDDPVKDTAESFSETALENTWDWYGSTAYTRIQGNGAVVLIMTRWSEDDLAGRLLRQMDEDPDADRWTVLRLPAFAEENDPLDRKIGEPLWPEVYGTAILNQRKKAAGSRGFTAVYQQRPSPAEGGMFKRHWWQRYQTFDRSQARQVIQVWDTAFETGEENDYSVCSTWALMPHGAYVLDVFRDRLDFPDLKRKAQDLYTAWQPHAVLIEKKASGHSLIQELDRETLLPVIPEPADRSKRARAAAVTPYIEAGRVYLPESAPWVDAWIEEHAAFDVGVHDDQVDTTSMALRRLFGGLTTFRPEDIQATIQDDLKPADWLFQ